MKWDNETLRFNVLAINDCEDHNYKRKIGYLQRYVKSLGKKLYQKIQTNGFFENAGQKEIRQAYDRFSKYGLGLDYQIETTIKANIRRFLEGIGNGDTFDQDWAILDQRKKQRQDACKHPVFIFQKNNLIFF